MTDRRGVSPVIGTILLVAIIVILASILLVAATGLVDFRGGAPQARFDTQPYDLYPGVTIRHQGGDSIAADRLTVRGGVVVEAFSGMSARVIVPS